MVANRKVTGNAMSMTTGVLIGTGIAVVITVIGALILAWLMDQSYLQEGGIGYGIMVILAASSVAAAWTTVALVKGQRLAMSLITGGIYLFLLMFVNGLCFGGQYEGLVPTVVLVLGGSLLPALLTNGRKGNRISVKHNRHYV